MNSVSQLNESAETLDTGLLKRRRYSLKTVNQILKDSEDESESEESEDESSEEDWNMKNRKRKSGNIKKKSPVQTLKKKLAEKTKTLRKSIKQNTRSLEGTENVSKTKEVETETTQDLKPKLPVTETLPDVVPVVNTLDPDGTTLQEIPPATIPIEAPVLIKKENLVKEENSKKEIIKSESTKEPDIIILDDIPPKKIEPVVLTYSTSKNSCNISPFLVATVPQNTTPPVTTSSSSRSPSIGRLRINQSLQSPRMFNNPLRKTVPPVTPTISSVPASPRTRTRTPIKRTPPSVSKSAENTLFRPRKLFDSRTISNTRVTPQKSTPLASKVPAPNLKNPGSLNRISPNGAVIYSGSNSVTITPRKKSPERRPVQRQLIKTDVEGIIAARVENGVLQYVVNLANGTHLPLTNLQVIKLREQNNGVLPSKLKIPVPSDVASQIEPRFVIDD